MGVNGAIIRRLLDQDCSNELAMETEKILYKGEDNPLQMQLTELIIENGVPEVLNELAIFLTCKNHGEPAPDDELFTFLSAMSNLLAAWIKLRNNGQGS